MNLVEYTKLIREAAKYTEDGARAYIYGGILLKAMELKEAYDLYAKHAAANPNGESASASKQALIDEMADVLHFVVRAYDLLTGLVIERIDAYPHHYVNEDAAPGFILKSSREIATAYNKSLYGGIGGYQMYATIDASIHKIIACLYYLATQIAPEDVRSHLEWLADTNAEKLRARGHIS